MIKKELSWADSFVYIIACVLTLGGAWALRVIITQGIIMAEDKPF